MAATADTPTNDRRRPLRRVFRFFSRPEVYWLVFVAVALQVWLNLRRPGHAPVLGVPCLAFRMGHPHIFSYIVLEHRGGTFSLTRQLTVDNIQTDGDFPRPAGYVSGSNLIVRTRGLIYPVVERRSASLRVSWDHPSYQGREAEVRALVPARLAADRYPIDPEALAMYAAGTPFTESTNGWYYAADAANALLLVLALAGAANDLQRAITQRRLRRRARTIARGNCPACGYGTRAHGQGVCPECGEELTV